MTAPTIPLLRPAPETPGVERERIATLPQLQPTVPQTTTSPDGRGIQTTLPPLPTSVKAARAFICGTLGAWSIAPGPIEDAELVASELFTNALVHAERPDPGRSITVRLTRTAEGVLLEVDDDDPVHLPNLTLQGEGTGGRGLWLALQLTQRIDVTTSHTGKTVAALIAI
jgi:anti-sigma regulatory factor (Ser/Thr protein kinase)